jgi:hypothetical protein
MKNSLSELRAANAVFKITAVKLLKEANNLSVLGSTETSTKSF